MANFVILTNNPKVAKKYSAQCDVDFRDVNYTEILSAVRDMIHKGHKLLTHPLAGSIKPNETPFKSIFVSKNAGKFDADSLMIIEESIVTCKKFTRLKFPNMSDTIRDDFSDIDLSLVDNAVVSAMMAQ